jgi:hypothetical protein
VFVGLVATLRRIRDVLISNFDSKILIDVICVFFSESSQSNAGVTSSITPRPLLATLLTHHSFMFL